MGVGNAPQHPGRCLGHQGHHHTIGPRAIEAGHIDPGNLRQIQQQCPAAKAGSLGLAHHQADFRQQLLPVAEGDEIEEVGVGLGIRGGGLATGKDKRLGLGVVERQVGTLPGPDRQADQIQHLQDVGGAKLIAETEAEDVEGAQATTALHGKQRCARAAQALGQIRTRQIGAITELAGQLIEDSIENDVAEVAGAHLVELRIGERPAHLRPIPVLVHGAQLIAQVAAGLDDVAVHQVREGNRIGQSATGQGWSLGHGGCGAGVNVSP